MNSNIKEISKVLKNFKSEEEVFEFLNEILTESELNILSKRWRILKLLAQGQTQRQIAQDLNVSLCNVTRGAKILKKNDAIVKKIMKG